MEPILAALQNQFDYLLFAGVVIIVMMTSVWGLGRFRPAARFPWQFSLLAMLMLVGGWFATQRAGEHAQAESSELISAMAPTYANELERAGHSRINENTPPDDPLYLSLIEKQIRWEKLNPFAHDIYTFRKRPDGTNILVVDSETDYDKNGRFEGQNESRTPIGKVYPQPVKGLELAYEGKANFDSEVYRDDWGEWVSAFVPMRDATGKVEAVLGVDFDAKAWLQAIAKARRGMIWVTAFLAAIILGTGISIALLRADIVQRAEAERRLRESEGRLLLTIRQLPLGFIEWNIDGSVRVWNPSAERIFGFTPEEVRDKKIFPLIVAPSAKQQVDEVWASLLRNTGGHHSINENQTKDARTIVCEWFNTPLVDADGKVIAIFSLIQDITARVNLEKQLHRSERLSAVGQLSAGVAHDFNNLLTVILGHTGLLLLRPGMSDAASADIQRIEDAASRAASLTRQLLAFSRRQAMFPRIIDLGKTVQDVAGMLSRLIRADTKFQVAFAGNLPLIEADPAMMEQIVTNLVINARDAIDKPLGEISVSVDAVEIAADAVPAFPNARPGKFVCLSVRDNGSGISAENLNRVFEPFFTTKAQGKGTGLGLSVVHGVVEQHGGWIAITSTVGVGTTFSIHLPLSERQVPGNDTALLPRAGTNPEPRKAKTILLAEDEEFVRDLAIKILESKGYTVIAAPDGVKALEQWAKHRDQIDLLFTDMVMPNGVGGRELSERILAERPNLPVIYASGYSIDTTAPGFCESERMLFLQKPYRPDQLLAAVHKCLESAAA